MIKLPFLGNISKKLTRNLSRLFQQTFDLKVMACYSTCKVGSYFQLKCKTSNFLASNVVYKFTCERDASDAYIGMTSRHLMIRIKEHLNEEGPKCSAVNDHLKSCRTCQNEKDEMKLFTLVRKCRSDYETR